MSLNNTQKKVGALLSYPDFEERVKGEKLKVSEM